MHLGPATILEIFFYNEKINCARCAGILFVPSEAEYVIMETFNVI